MLLIAERLRTCPMRRQPLGASEFDVFVSYNRVDQPEVKQVTAKLVERGLRVWLDTEQLQPGIPWEPVLESQIRSIHSAAVFVGSDGMGPWQALEVSAILRQFVKRGAPVIPTILPSAKKNPQLPLFLEGHTWVDFRKADPDPVEQLIWGITSDPGHA
jgi:hypothetical protein